MALGLMNTPISIVQVTTTYDAEGFPTKTDVTKVQTRAIREHRHGSVVWRNRAAFSEATDSFVIRKPQVEITTDMTIVCGTSRFDVVNIENIKGRGMYIEILSKEVVPSGKS